MRPIQAGKAAQEKRSYRTTFLKSSLNLPCRHQINVTQDKHTPVHRPYVHRIKHFFFNLVFHVEGSADSPGRYLPVCSAHSLNNMASFWTSKSGLSACFHETRNSLCSLLRQHNPGTFPLFIFCSNHSLSRCRSSVMSPFVSAPFFFNLLAQKRLSSRICKRMSSFGF